MTQVANIFSNRYEIQRGIARGGMAEVYLARDQLLDRPVAIKVLSPEFAREPSFVERFRREAQSAANLNHPNVVAIYDWGQERGTYFIVMEYVQGRPLRDMIRAEGPLPTREAAEIAAAIAAALAFAHRGGLVHRDVKPGNVLITPGNEVKVTDFGIAYAGTGESLTQTGAVMGTATYFSPEQAQGLPVDGRSDVYSLGIVLYEMVTGRPPFTGDSPVTVAYKHVREEPPRPSELVPDLPPDLERIILAAMAKDVDARYQSADDLRADLQRFARGQPPVGGPVTAVLADVTGGTATAAAAARTQVAPAVAEPEYTRPPGRRRWGTVIGSLMGLGLLAVVIVLLIVTATDSKGGGVQTIGVPGVVNQPFAQAELFLKGQGFKVRRIYRQDNQPPDIVRNQDPTKGEKLAKGKTVKLTVSSPTFTMPSLTDTQRTEAVDQLIRLGLQDAANNVVVMEQESDKPPGTVLVTNPAPGANALKAGKVTLVVAKEPLIPIPDVRQQPAATAKSLLEQSNLHVTIKSEPSDTIEAGRATRTDPGVGAQVKKGDTITLFVSTGPEQVDVPNVVTRTLDQARVELQGTGFQVNVFTQPSGQADDGKVLAQNPSGGQKAPKGSTVTVTVGKFPAGP